MMAAAKKKATHIRHPKHSARLRLATLRAMRLLHEDPITAGRVVEILGIMLKKGDITARTFYRIAAAPLSPITLKAKLRAFAKGKMPFAELIESVDLAYERAVPKPLVDMVIKCREGEFYGKVLRLAMLQGSPTSLVTALTLRRMRYLRKPAEEIAEAERIKWGIHQQSHLWHKAQARNDKRAMVRKRKKMLELEHTFIEKFTKDL